MQLIHGNTAGLSPSETKALQRIYRRRVRFDVLTTPELTRSLCEVSHSAGRQVGVLVDRTVPPKRTPYKSLPAEPS